MMLCTPSFELSGKQGFLRREQAAREFVFWRRRAFAGILCVFQESAAKSGRKLSAGCRRRDKPRLPKKGNKKALPDTGKAQQD